MYVSEKDLLKLAGIEDLSEFYRERFFTGGVLDARYFDPLSRFDIHFARTMWVYDNVRRGSSVLDLGCGEGVLALLRRKDVTLVGVDLSTALLGQARRNAYDAVYVANLTALPFADSSFDYVISLDLLGHIPFDRKQDVLAEIKRVLRPGGVTMHGIECLDRELHQDYDEMSEEKLRRFVAIDGHIGLEDDDQHADRFRAIFENVETMSRYTLCLSSDEFIKQADEYKVPFEADFIEYLRGLSFNERRAFDMAMGYVFGKISDLGIRLPKSGLYMLLKASDRPLDSFYNAHRDRADLFALPSEHDSQWICLDRDSRALFDSGWYGANNLPPIARWMADRATIRFQADFVSRLQLDLTTHIPDLEMQPVVLQFRLNGRVVSVFSLCRYGWLRLEIINSYAAVSNSKENLFELEIRASRTWQPCKTDPNSKDDRFLSVAVCNIEIQS